MDESESINHASLERALEVNSASELDDATSEWLEKLRFARRNN